MSNEDEPIFLEQTFVSGNFVAGVGYGIQMVLYTHCALYLWRELRRKTIFAVLLAYITLLLSLQSVVVSASTWTVVDAYVNHQDYSGGPWNWFLATQYLPEDVLFISFLFILTFLSDLLVLWRCWVIWSSSGKVVASLVTAFPILILLASFALGTTWCLRSSEPGSSLYSDIPMTFGTAYYMTSLCVNIVVTILIVLRLLIHRRSVLRSLPPEHAKHYLSLATVFIESASLYTISALGFIISYAANHPINQFFLAVSGTCQQISGYLIILRVAQGTAWNANTSAVTTLSTPQLTTLQCSSPVSSVPDDSGVELLKASNSLSAKPKIPSASVDNSLGGAVMDSVPKVEV